MGEALNIGAVRARADAATPGPWHRDGKSVCHNGPNTGPVGSKWGVTVVASVGAYEGGRPSEADAEFIAHARTDVPELIDALKEAEHRGYARAVARLRDDERYRSWWTAREYAPEDRYWESAPRNHLADYLETVERPMPGEQAKEDTRG